MMISEKLLKEVMGDEVTKCFYNGNNIIFKEYRTMIDRSHLINIYELAHKCKEWALKYGYILVSHTLKISSICSVKHINDVPPFVHSQEILNADTEPEAIFKACEWILKQKDNNEQ